MDDLISRAAAIDAMRECWRCVNQFAKPFEANRIMDCIKAVKELPAVDAAPVVRCQYCKYGEPETNGFSEDMVMCQNKQNPIRDGYWLMPPEFYCADGERRDSE